MATTNTSKDNTDIIIQAMSVVWFVCTMYYIIYSLILFMITYFDLTTFFLLIITCILVFIAYLCFNISKKHGVHIPLNDLITI